MKRSALNMKKLLFVAAPTIGLLVSPSQAWAGPTLFNTVSNCTALDCGGSTIIANYVYEQPFSQGIPFTVQLFSAGNECLRVSVTAQNLDSEAALVSPDNQVWLNDDFNGLRPRIVARTTVKGWYTLQLTKFDGGGPGGQITFKYGRYPLSNQNCSNPTTALSAAQPAQRKPVEAQPPTILP